MPTSLPASSEFTSNTQDQGDMKAVFSALRDFLAGLLGTDGATATALATLGAPLSGYVAKTTTYSAVAADKGKLIDCTGTWSLGLLAAATAGDAFCIGARNSGTGTITIDANLSETINGATTLALNPGESALVYCNGTSWVCVGTAAAAASQAEMEAGTETGLRQMSPLRVAQAIAALVDTAVPDVGASGVGLMAICVIASGSVASGATVAGSSLRAAIGSSTSEGIGTSGTPLTGTWRNCTPQTLTAGAADMGMFQRIS